MWRRIPVGLEKYTSHGEGISIYRRFARTDDNCEGQGRPKNYFRRNKIINSLAFEFIFKRKPNFSLRARYCKFRLSEM
ncbi:MAG: hypothetical protein DMG58_22070 [Acidobacteria bacterium]|nr:MAG: hypothetical protein DMG58_22070 [Acidobacteriota bacterium]